MNTNNNIHNGIFLEPSCHSYLGDRLKDHKIKQTPTLEYDINTTDQSLYNHSYDLLLIHLSDVIIFPYDTIPLRLTNEELIKSIQSIINYRNNDIINHNSTFIGIISNKYITMQQDSSRSISRGYNELSKIGTTIEITASYVTPNNDEMIITAKGQYRYKIRNTYRMNSINYAKVQILSELLPSNNYKLFRSIQYQFRFEKYLEPFSNIYNQITLSQLAKTSYKLYLKSSFIGSNSQSIQLVEQWGPISTNSLNVINNNNDNNNNYNNNNNNNHYSNNDNNNNNNNYNTKTDVDDDILYGAEINPIRFSFYLSANLPVSPKDTQELLEASDTFDRLRLCMKYMDRKHVFLVCSICQLPISSKEKMFTVPGAEGTTGAYVNQYGAVHQTITVSDLVLSEGHNTVGLPLVLEGIPCIQDSWFPGYAWTIARCRRCMNHLGWRFTLATTALDRYEIPISYDSNEIELYSISEDDVDSDNNNLRYDDIDNGDIDNEGYDDIEAIIDENNMIDTQMSVDTEAYYSISDETTSTDSFMYTELQNNVQNLIALDNSNNNNNNNNSNANNFEMIVNNENSNRSIQSNVNNSSTVIVKQFWGLRKSGLTER